MDQSNDHFWFWSQCHKQMDNKKLKKNRSGAVGANRQNMGTLVAEAVFFYSMRRANNQTFQFTNLQMGWLMRTDLIVWSECAD